MLRCLYDGGFCHQLFGLLPAVGPASRHDLAVRVVQNEVLQRCVIPAKAGIQSHGTRGQFWMPAFAGMTLTFLSHPPHFERLTRLADE